MTQLTCSECGNEVQDRICGHEYTGVYDGVLFWQCMECGHCWPRTFGDWAKMNALSEVAATHANAERRKPRWSDDE